MHRKGEEAMHRAPIVAAGVVALGLLAAGPAHAAVATQVHGLSPYPNPGGCHGAAQNGTLYVNSEVEPWVGDNDKPSASADPDALIGTWQQDRFSSGGSSGLLVAYSHDGGLTWTVPPLADQPAITNCQDPDNSGSNSDWERATDPWADISPNGDMWHMSLSFNDTRNLRNAMLVSKSEDGGAHWTEPVTLIDDPNPHVFNDKNSLTADPNDSDLVYATWDRLVFPNERSRGDASSLVAAAFKGPTYFSRTENGTDDDGGDWTTRRILDLGENDQTIGNVIAVLPRTAGQTESTLIDVFDWIHNDNKGGRKGEKISAIWSTDSGDTWSDPVVIDPIANAVVRDRDPDGAPCPETLGLKFDPYVCRLRTGDGTPDVAVDMASGTLYAVWQDGEADKVVVRLAKSADHGQSWTQLGIVNTVPTTDAHTPSVEVAADATVAVTYYDFRFNDVGAGDGLETAHWIRRSTNGGASFGPDELLGTTFDTRKAPYALGYFLGDYDGLGTVGNAFKPFWTSTQGSVAGKPVLDGGVDFADRTNVFAASVP